MTAVAIESLPLTPPERKTFSQCEQAIERGRKSFVEVGNALLQIREGKLYRATHKTFDGYCKERWGYKNAYVTQLIGSSRVAEHLANTCNCKDSIVNESQIRPLLALSDRSDEDHRERVIDLKAVAEVWQQVEEKAPKDEDGAPKITAKLVKEVVHDYITPGDELEAEAAPEPEADQDPPATCDLDAERQWLVRTVLDRSKRWPTIDRDFFAQILRKLAKDITE